MADPNLVSVLIPVFNEELNIERAYEAVVGVFDGLEGYDLEIIFTDNHSTDTTFSLLRGLSERDPRVGVIRFSRNVGYQRSVLAAYQAANGDCAVQLDCDLQDPPELIPRMLKLWQDGNRVVYGIRRSLPDGRLMTATRRLFYRTINALSEDPLPLNAGEFRLVDRRVLDELRLVRDTTPYPRGQISAMGFQQIGFDYDRQPRLAGESKFPLKALISVALNGLLNHSLVPLRIASLTSLVIGTITSVFIFVYLIAKFIFGQDWPPGFATTTILLLLSITLNAMFLGIIGEYLGRIFLQVKRLGHPIEEYRLNINPRNKDG